MTALPMAKVIRKGSIKDSVSWCPSAINYILYEVVKP